MRRQIRQMRSCKPALINWSLPNSQMKFWLTWAFIQVSCPLSWVWLKLFNHTFNPRHLSYLAVDKSPIRWALFVCFPSHILKHIHNEVMVSSKNDEIVISATKRFARERREGRGGRLPFCSTSRDVVTAFLRESLYSRTETNYRFHK